MIRSYYLKKPIPKKAFLAAAGEVQNHWHQTTDLPRELVLYALSELPVYKTFGLPSLVLHSTYSEIPSHTDGLAKTVFVFPISFGRNNELVVDGERTRFQKGKMYRFNDHLKHELTNPNFARVVLLTASFES